ncbi:MAG: hypothetical protein WCA35_30540, partial [Kovacikia sp.]
QQLGGKADSVQVGKVAELIIQTMTGPWRFFHTPEHIFEVGEEGDAVEVLAALFHDLVYVQVDQGVSVNISAYISSFVKEINGKLVIRDHSELPDDRMFEMVAQIFGFSAELVMVPTAGQNEFLSAVIAAKCLEYTLEPSVIAQIAACIEATIPFRGKSETGKSPSECLYARLLQINESFGLGWSKDDLDKMVERSVRLANRDVKNFAYRSSADFLDNTWNLLPETNHDLKNANSYTVQGYRESLQKMEGFMYFLKPDLVFQQFGQEPDEATYQELILRTGRNIDVARLYLGCKLLSIAIIEALSRRIGRGIPVATMTGELPLQGTLPLAQLENFLPHVNVMPHPPETDLEWEVLGLLEKGRNQASIYDTKNSPVTTFIIKSIGFSEARRLLTGAKAFFAEEISPEAFLEMCDRAAVEAITNGILQVFESRKLALRRVNLESKVGG